MAIHLPRFRLRTFLIVVAVGSAVIGQGAVWWRISAERRRIRDRYATLNQQEWREAIRYPMGHPLRGQHSRVGLSYLKEAWRYEYAASEPWKPVPPKGSIPIPIQRPARKR